MPKKLKLIVDDSMTFEQGFKEFLESCKARNIREGTVKHYRESFVSITRFINSDALIRDFNKQTVDNFVKDCINNNTMNSQTLYTYTRDLKTMFYFFMKMEYMPTFKIKLPSVDKVAIETYTDAELKVLLKKPDIKHCNFATYRDWVIINFLLSTGVRLNSLINIKVKEIDFGNEVVHVNVTKNRKPLIIPLNVTIIKILKEYLKYRQSKNMDDYLFPNTYGAKISKSAIAASLSKFNKDRGIVTTGIHRYRHTFAKKFILSGMPVTSLQKLLGHSSLLITEHYLNILVTDLKKDIEKFNILQEFTGNHIKLR